MKILFKNITTYSQHMYDDFLKFHKNHFSFSYNLFSIVISMLFLFFIILYVKNRYYGLAFIFCAFLTAFILYRYFHPIEEVREEYNSDKITKSQSFTFLFYDKSFKIYTKKEYSIIRYSELYKVFETDKFFYLYLDNRHSFILDKSGFKKGSSKAFTEFIKKKCPFKFKSDKSN